MYSGAVGQTLTLLVVVVIPNTVLVVSTTVQAVIPGTSHWAMVRHPVSEEVSLASNLYWGK